MPQPGSSANSPDPKEHKRQQSFNSELDARLQNERPTLFQRATSLLNQPGARASPPPLTPRSEVPEDLSRKQTVDTTSATANSNDNLAEKRIEFAEPDVGPIPPLDPDIEAAHDKTVGRLIPHRNNLKEYFLQEVAHNYFLEAQLLLLTFATGIIDALSYVSYNCFVSKQTGNTVLMALWANKHAQITGGIEANVGFSIIFFVFGAAVFGHIGHLLIQRRRSWLLLSNFIQTMLVFTALIIRWCVSDERVGPIATIIVSILSFASGGQISLALCVKLPELNTTMITGCLIQLATDKRALALHNIARNRRVLFFTSLFAGALAGAASAQYVSGNFTLLLYGIVKTIVFFSFFLNHGLVRNPRSTPSSGTVTPLTRIIWGD